LVWTASHLESSNVDCWLTESLRECVILLPE
jgi:hypothetical protein